VGQTEGASHAQQWHRLYYENFQRYTMSRREFTFSEGTSNKFWAIELDGKRHTVNFGRIGTSGQTQTKEFSSADEAKKSYEKLAAEKVKKGYVEAGAATAAAALAYLWADCVVDAGVMSGRLFRRLPASSETGAAPAAVRAPRLPGQALTNHLADRK
jgi:predicted DNA-binding WGR domain protein